MSTKLVTVFGGSGFVGRHVVRELAKRGYRVRAAVRRPHLANFLRPMGDVGQVQVVQANIRYRPSIANALKDADAVVNATGILTQSGSQSFTAMHAQGPKSIAELAAKEGINAFVHLSAIGADADSDALYAQSKAAGEQLVAAALPSATILRPSLVFGPKDEFFNRFALLARFSLALPSIGGGKTKFQPIYVDDVADAVCAAIDTETARGRTYELGGPSVYSFNELMQLMFEIIERKRILLPVPFPVANMIGWAGQIAGRVLPGGPPLTEDQVKLLKRDNVVGESGEENIGVIQDLGVTPETLQAVLPTYLERFRKYGQFEPRRVA